MATIVSESSLRHLLRHFPKHNLNYAFAYGSAVFVQHNQTPGKMIDLVLVVDNAVEWHKENLCLNRGHYSSLKYLGAKVITSIQERMASGVYYNPFVHLDGQLIKYGVISTSSLEKDLLTWNQIYIAGRLHKPVLDLKPSTSASLLSALKYNRESALRTVLLQEGRYFSKFSLYHGITELSYLGDSRMKLAENPEKTRNIVTPLLPQFDSVYIPLIQNIQPSVEFTKAGLFAQDTTPQGRFKHLMALPNPIQVSLARQLFRDPRLFDIEEVMAELSYLPTLKIYVRNAVSEVVWGSSILQTVQGLLTAGIGRSIKYAYDKLKKGRQGRVKVEPEQRLRLPPPKTALNEQEYKDSGSLKDSTSTLGSGSSTPSTAEQTEEVKGKEIKQQKL